MNKKMIIYGLEVNHNSDIGFMHSLVDHPEVRCEIDNGWMLHDHRVVNGKYEVLLIPKETPFAEQASINF